MRRVFRALERALGSEDAGVRRQAAHALGMIESGTAVEGLSRAFTAEQVPAIRAEIVWGLGMIEDRGVVDAMEDPERGVRDKAPWALGMIMN